MELRSAVLACTTKCPPFRSDNLHVTQNAATRQTCAAGISYEGFVTQIIFLPRNDAGWIGREPLKNDMKRCKTFVIVVNGEKGFTSAGGAVRNRTIPWCETPFLQRMSACFVAGTHKFSSEAWVRKVLYVWINLFLASWRMVSFLWYEPRDITRLVVSYLSRLALRNLIFHNKS